MLKTLAHNSYDEMEYSLKNIDALSNLYKTEKEIVYNLYNKVYRLKNHVVSVNETEYYTSILVLSSEVITLIDELLSSRTLINTI